MRVSEFIASLESQLAKHGDHDIVDHNGMEVDEVFYHEDTEEFEIL